MPDEPTEEKKQKRRQTLTAFLRGEATAQGFDLCRVTRPDSIPEARPRLDAFLDEGLHGTMDWMAETRERRGDPRVLWPDVRSIVVLRPQLWP